MFYRKERAYASMCIPNSSINWYLCPLQVWLSCLFKGRFVHLRVTLWMIILNDSMNIFRVKQQDKMANYLRTIFGDSLLVDPLEKYPVSKNGGSASCLNHMTPAESPHFLGCLLFQCLSQRWVFHLFPSMFYTWHCSYFGGGDSKSSITKKKTCFGLPRLQARKLNLAERLLHCGTCF